MSVLGDWRRVRRLGRYLNRDRRRLLLTLTLLIPVALAGAIQPLLVGQAISVLRGEASLPWLASLPVSAAIRTLIGLLLASVLLRLAFQGLQTFNIQAIGQRLTARIRDDLFSHSLSLSLRFHDGMPVGKLLTRLTSDVDALAEVFGSGAVGVLGDLVSLLVIATTMLLIEWRLGLLLLCTQVPVTLVVLWLQRRYRKANYRVREELSQLNADFQENLQGLEVVQMFRREQVNGQRFAQTGSAYRQAVNGTIFFRQQYFRFSGVGCPWGRCHGACRRWLDGDQWRYGTGHPHHVHPVFPATFRPSAAAGGTLYSDSRRTHRGGADWRTA